MRQLEALRGELSSASAIPKVLKPRLVVVSIDEQVGGCVIFWPLEEMTQLSLPLDVAWVTSLLDPVEFVEVVGEQGKGF